MQINSERQARIGILFLSFYTLLCSSRMPFSPLERVNYYRELQLTLIYYLDLH